MPVYADGVSGLFSESTQSTNKIEKGSLPDRGYLEAQLTTISAGSRHTVALKSDGTVVAVGMNDQGQCNVDSWNNIIAVSTGTAYTVGLKSDGTVVAIGLNDSSQCDVLSWSDIVEISAGACHTVGLKSDGTVVAIGAQKNGRCNVGNWTDIQMLAR